MIHDVIIVGSGATGIASALGFSESGIVPLMLDVGKVPAKRSGIDGNFYDHRKKNDSFNLMIGPEYEGLYNILNNTSLPPKLTAPEMSFVTEDNAELSRTREEGFTAMQSFARGGLANAWGAGLYRCVSDELKDMPLSVEELAPYYEMLTQEVGISGDSDDLASFFGSVDGLLPPLNLSLKAERLYSKYHKKRDGLNKNGVYAGRPRLGVLSRNHGGRRAYMYQNNDMWLSDTPFLYTPAMTLQKLIDKQAVNYESGILVQRWSGDQGEITVYGRRLSDGIEVEYKCRNLVLAAGTINSSKIVLRSRSDFSTELPLIDNPLVQLPLLFPSFVGKKLETAAAGMTNLNVIFNFPEQRLQGSVIELTSPARSVFYEMFPLAARDNLRCMKFLSTSVLVLFLYFESNRENLSSVRLREDSVLTLKSKAYSFNRKLISRAAKAMRKMGALTSSRIARYSAPGYAIHYAGTLPMKEVPEGPYECDKYGRLNMEEGVYISDGSLFSYIPAKNISFTLMANSMRIANYISKRIRRS